MNPPCQPPRRRAQTAATAALALFALSPDAGAGPTRSVRVTTYQELAEGQDYGVLISSKGEVRAGHAATRTAMPSLSDDSVRAIAVLASGAVYLGSGGEAATILVMDRPEDGKVRKLAQLDAGTWVTALCPFEGGGRPAGHVLVGTAQDGRLWDVGPDGKFALVAQLEATEHVWAIERDAGRGLTYVATGPGRLWALEDRELRPDKPATKGRKLFESPGRQFLSLLRGEDGGLYVGTTDDAVLYRVTPAGEVRAIHDFAGNELRAIAQHKGVLYVAVNDMQRGEAVSRGVKITPAAAGTVPGVKAAPAAGASTPPSTSPVDKKGRGALFRIDPSGRVEQLHAIVDGFFNALAVDGGGQIFATASTPGGRGRIYQVQPDRTVQIILEAKESDILTVALPPSPSPSLSGVRLFGTGNSGAIYRLGDAPPKDASYLSKVIDAQVVSRWGAVRYVGSGGLKLETRSGNLGKPDASWSPWQPLAQPGRSAVTGEQSGKSASPPGRYLQVRASFAAQAVLSDFTVYYQPLNQPARVTEILIGEDPLGLVARGPKPPPLRPKLALVKLRWKVENPDGDELNYRLYVRPQGLAAQGPGVGWLRLGGPDPLLRTEFDWNTELVADGMYEVRVVASDERVNPGDTAQSHELIAPPVVVDNRRPELTDVSYHAASAILSGRVSDSATAIVDLSYQVDGGDLLPMPPSDGVLDDTSEAFSFKLPPLAPGPHTLLVRATDAADNVGVVQLVVQGPGQLAAQTPGQPASAPAGANASPAK